jgi:hypothetical protein
MSVKPMTWEVVGLDESSPGRIFLSWHSVPVGVIVDAGVI